MSRKDERSIEVETDCGVVSAGVVGAFFGLVPDVKFLARSGLHIERGVLVDEFLNAGFAGVYAAGDCAQVYHPGLRDYWVSIGYENARRLGRLAALNLLGAGLAADASGESVFDVEGVRLNTSWWTEF
jgi:NADPH-dependent 2,4-dienoyl-CoA reductase/sulfur reductase-like enzyme